MKTFKSYITEQSLDEIPKEVQEHLSWKIPMILHQANQAHIFHLITKDFKLHNALEELYDSLRDQADNIGEAWIGLSQELKIPEFPKLSLDFNDLEDFLNTCIVSNETCLELTKDINALTAINDNVVQIQAALQKMLYMTR